MIKKLATILTSFLIALTPATTLALTEEQRSLFRTSGIVFYDPNGYNAGNACIPLTTSGSPSGTITTSHTAAFLERWHDTAVQVQILYGIPWEAVMGQAAQESGWGRSNYAVNKNAYFGVNAVDSNPDLGYAYSTPELSWYGSTHPPSYAEFIRDNPRYRNHGAFDYVDDPFGYIAAVKAAYYASDPNYVQSIISIINNIIRPYSIQKGWADSAGVAAANPDAAANATANAQGANATGSDNSLPTNLCPPDTIPGSNTDGLPFDINGTNNAKITACWGRYPSGGAHTGLDTGIAVGSPIYATMSGTIIHVGRQNNNPDGYGNGGGFGYYVSINYGNGITAYYAHMQDGSSQLRAGDTVTKGQPIGRSGNTGNSTGPHLHYEVRSNNKPIDPRPYMGDFSAIDDLGCSL